MPRWNEPPSLINPIELSEEDRAIVEACKLVRSIAEDRANAPQGQTSIWDWDTKAHHDKQDEDERQYYEDRMMELLESVDALRRDLDRFQDSSQHQPGHEERRLRISRRLSILNKYALERPVTASPPALPVSMPVEDVERLTSAKERVQRFMADGQWHTAAEIREVGGSEGLRRLRELRQDGHVIDKRKVKGGLYEYRVCGWLPWGGE